MTILIVLFAVNAALLSLHLVVQLWRERVSIYEMLDRVHRRQSEEPPKKVMITDADEREARRLAHENTNFLNYDGGKQPQYDENAAEDGK